MADSASSSSAAAAAAGVVGGAAVPADADTKVPFRSSDNVKQNVVCRLNTTMSVVLEAYATRKARDINRSVEEIRTWPFVVVRIPMEDRTFTAEDWRRVLASGTQIDRTRTVGEIVRQDSGAVIAAGPPELAPAAVGDAAGVFVEPAAPPAVPPPPPPPWPECAAAKMAEDADATDDEEERVDEKKNAVFTVIFNGSSASTEDITYDDVPATATMSSQIRRYAKATGVQIATHRWLLDGKNWSMQSLQKVSQLVTKEDKNTIHIDVCSARHGG